jgi:tetratricopeptide (TPR) repeat protein
LSCSRYDQGISKTFDQLRQKYEKAANEPFEPVAPDPLPPDRPERTLDKLGRREYNQALADFTEQISRYPDLFQAHHRRAEILATCPDGRFRNGKEAIASATRACELTSWERADAVATLAAAYAEAGDFARAVDYEQKAQDRYAAGGRVPPGRWRPERMALYQAGRPYHDAH